MSLFPWTPLRTTWLVLSLMWLTSIHQTGAADGYLKTSECISIVGNSTLELSWTTAIPKDNILWCFYQHAQDSDSGWDQFLGYHYEKKERQNISSHQIGWVFLNGSAPCQRGIRKDKATQGMGGQYQMVVIARNTTQYKSDLIQATVSYCTASPEVQNTRSVLTLAGSPNSIANYTCNGGLNFTDGDTIKQITCLETGNWSGTIPDCDTQGVIVDNTGQISSLQRTRTALVLFVCICFIVILLMVFYLCYIKGSFKKKPIVFKVKTPKDVRGSPEGYDGSEMLLMEARPETEQHKNSLEFIERFDAQTIPVKHQKTLKLVVVVGSPSKPTVEWFRNNTAINAPKTSVKEDKQTKGRYICTLERDNITPDMTGMYKCVLKSSGVTLAHENHVSIFKEFIPSQFETEMAQLPDPVCVDVDIADQLSYPLYVSGTPLPTVTWSCYKDGVLLEHNDIINITQEVENNQIKLTLTFNKVKCTLASSCMLEIQAKNEADTEPCKYMTELIMQKKPSIMVGLIDQCTEVNKPVEFSCMVVAHPAPVFEWYFGDTLHDIGISNTDESQYYKYISKASLSKSRVGVFPVVAKAVNTLQEGVTSEAKLYVVEKKILPSIRPKLNDVKVEEGSDAVFCVEVHGDPRPNIKWSTANPALPEDKCSASVKETQYGYSILAVYTITNCQLSDSCTVMINAHSPLSEHTHSSIAAKLIVQEKAKEYFEAPQILKYPERILVCKGDDAKIEIEVCGKPTPTVTCLVSG